MHAVTVSVINFSEGNFVSGFLLPGGQLKGL